MKRHFAICFLAIVCLVSASVPALAAASPEPPVVEGLSPLPAELQESFDRLVEETVRWRGLDAGSEIPAGVQDAASLRRRLETLLDGELPPDVMSAMDLALKRFGLIPEDSDFRTSLLELLASQVAGYFDTESGHILMVDGDQGVLGEAFDEELGEALGARMEESLLVHEIGHFLQHRHFDLEELMSGGPISDEVLARQSLIEGDAALVMFSYMIDFAVERLPMFETLFQEMVADPELMLAMSPDLPGSDELAGAPPYLRDNLLFPYLQGMVFCVQVRLAGGQPLLDHAFRDDPPRSSEQILHPEKWLAERDPPILVELPDLSGILKGWDKSIEGSWGELNTAIALGVRSGDDDRARNAAEGWGGDAFALYRRGRKDAVVWITEWDSEADADEFLELAAEAFADWRVAAAGPRRVVLYDAKLPGKKLRALETALHDAKASRADSPNLDLAALGITDDDLPQPFGLQDSVQLMESPFFREVLASGLSPEQAGMLEQQLDNPEVQAEIERMMQDMGPEDLEKLQQSPAVQQLLEQVAAAETPEITREGNVFRIVDLGFHATAPIADGWQVLDPQPGMGTPLALFEGEGGGWALIAMLIKMPMPVPLQAMTAGIEAALPFTDLERASETHFDGPPDGFEIEYTGLAEGEPVRMFQRLYSAGGFVLSVQALGKEALWDDVGEPVRAFLDSISFEVEDPG